MTQNEIIITEKQSVELSVTLNKIKVLTNAMDLAHKQGSSAFIGLRDSRENAILNLRMKMKELNLPVPPMKINVILPF